MRKAEVIERGLAFHSDAPRSAFETLRRAGGREIAAIAGAVLRARQLRVPVMPAGFICTAAIGPLAAANPAIVRHCAAGPSPAEPGPRPLPASTGPDTFGSRGRRLGEQSGRGGWRE